MKGKKTPPSQFLTSYNDLGIFKTQARSLIIDKCGFGKDAFYSRLKKPTTCSKIEYAAIEQILQKFTQLHQQNQQQLATI